MAIDITHDKDTYVSGNLSKNLDVLTAEIKGYQNMAGQSVFEIGKRLNWVKENDLAHGEWLTWLDSMNIGETFARRSIKIFNELGDSNQATLPDLSMSVLYEISTLPPEEREKEHITKNGILKNTEDMTAREIREYKRQLKESQDSQRQLEKEISYVKNQAAEDVHSVKAELDRSQKRFDDLKEKRNQEKLDFEAELEKVQAATNTKIVDRVVEPSDYQELKHLIKVKEAELEGNETVLAEFKKETKTLKDRAYKYFKTDEEFRFKQETIEELKQNIANLKGEKESRVKAHQAIQHLETMINTGNRLVSNMSLVKFDEYDETLANVDKVTNQLSLLVNELREKLAEYGIEN
ncbi:DUF3102 domain-containing protein (plasmid) [Fructilactobacillus vespulae]|uniref:DUF3102 domain-containing protein n=1 Tax=Fructilactobacillus vespulae TaxID=1249630 RepID=UPI0039B439D4